MPLSGAARTSCRTVADSLSRSAAVSASRLVDAIPKHNSRLTLRRMFDTPRSWYRDASHGCQAVNRECPTGAPHAIFHDSLPDTPAPIPATARGRRCVGLVGLLALLLQPQLASATPEIVSFRENPTLRGVLYKPDGPGPFPGLIYNHGSAPGMLNQQAFEALGPLFARRGWVFFAPYRRGQGLSATAGPFIGDEIASARNKGTWVGLFVAVPASLLLFLAVSAQATKMASDRLWSIPGPGRCVWSALERCSCGRRCDGAVARNGASQRSTRRRRLVTKAELCCHASHRHRRKLVRRH